MRHEKSSPTRRQGRRRERTPSSNGPRGQGWHPKVQTSPTSSLFDRPAQWWLCPLRISPGKLHRAFGAVLSSSCEETLFAPPREGPGRNGGKGRVVRGFVPRSEGPHSICEVLFGIVSSSPPVAELLSTLAPDGRQIVSKRSGFRPPGRLGIRWSTRSP